MLQREEGSNIIIITAFRSRAKIHQQKGWLILCLFSFHADDASSSFFVTHPHNILKVKMVWI